jgi:hypothetical protein
MQLRCKTQSFFKMAGITHMKSQFGLECVNCGIYVLHVVWLNSFDCILLKCICVLLCESRKDVCTILQHYWICHMVLHTTLRGTLTVPLCMVVLEMSHCIFIETNSGKCRNGKMCRYNLEDFYLQRYNTL